MTTTTQHESALLAAERHGWTTQTITHSDGNTGVCFNRGAEAMTSEWRDGNLVWADYSGPDEPDCVYTEHLTVAVEFLSTLPTSASAR